MALNSSAGLPSGSKCDPGKQATGKCVTGEAETSQVIMVIRHGERLDNLDHTCGFIVPCARMITHHRRRRRTGQKSRTKICGQGKHLDHRMNIRLTRTKNIKCVVSSPFLRCLQTAQRVCDTLALPGIHTCNDIVDVLSGHCGIHEQPVVPVEGIAQLGINVLEFDATELPKYPEKTKEGRSRFCPAFNKLANRFAPHNIVIVTHGYGVQEVAEGVKGGRVWVNYCGHVELRRTDKSNHKWTYVDSRDVYWSQ